MTYRYNGIGAFDPNGPNSPEDIAQHEKEIAAGKKQWWDYINPVAGGIVGGVTAGKSIWDTLFGKKTENSYTAPITEVPSSQPQPKGMPGWGWALIGVGGLVVVGTLVAVMKPKK